jgi:hypothetical protein
MTPTAEEILAVVYGIGLVLTFLATSVFHGYKDNNEPTEFWIGLPACLVWPVALFYLCGFLIGTKWRLRKARMKEGG